MDMPLNLIVLEQRGRERGSKGEKKGSVWAEVPSTVSFIWNNPTGNYTIKKIISFCPPLAALSLARAFSGTGEIAETACPPRHPVRLSDKHFLELGNKIVNFAVLNMLVLRVKWIWRAEEVEGGLFLSALWGCVAHYTGLLSYNGCCIHCRDDDYGALQYIMEIQWHFAGQTLTVYFRWRRLASKSLKITLAAQLNKICNRWINQWDRIITQGY